MPIPCSSRKPAATGAVPYEFNQTFLLLAGTRINHCVITTKNVTFELQMHKNVFAVLGPPMKKITAPSMSFACNNRVLVKGRFAALRCSQNTFGKV